MSDDERALRRRAEEPLLFTRVFGPGYDWQNGRIFGTPAQYGAARLALLEMGYSGVEISDMIGDWAKEKADTQ